LHAQILYACAKIEKTVATVAHNTNNMAKHNAGLCGGHQDCSNLDCDSDVNSKQGLCCEESAALTISPDTQQNTPAINLTEVESDVDPPKVLDTTFDIIFPSPTIAMFVVRPRINSVLPGSNTYLITQRLRI